MTIRTDILQIPALLSGEQLSCAQIAEQIGCSVVACRSTVANMARDGALVAHKAPRNTRLYSLGTEKSASTFSVRQLYALWRPTRIPEELLYDAHS